MLFQTGYVESEKTLTNVSICWEIVVIRKQFISECFIWKIFDGGSPTILVPPTTNNQWICVRVLRRDWNMNLFDIFKIDSISHCQPPKLVCSTFAMIKYTCWPHNRSYVPRRLKYKWARHDRNRFDHGMSEQIVWTFHETEPCVDGLCIN